MENYLYFRKLRPVTATATFSGSSNATNAFTGVGVAANLDNINEIASVAITSAAGGGTGHASILFETTAVLPVPTYSSTALAIATGSIHYIDPAGQALSNGVLTLDAHTTTGGYTLASSDTVTITFKQGLETSFMYPVSALKGMVATDTNTTSLHFASILGDATDDVVTIEHANGKFEDICKLMNDACNAFPRDGRLISVIDLGFGKTEILGGDNPASITSIEYAPEGGAAGMAT
tara:strand:+ start:84 stop:788 length:705 start_codon:yes stop_codon:yes gene_type:complete